MNSRIHNRITVADIVVIVLSLISFTGCVYCLLVELGSL